MAVTKITYASDEAINVDLWDSTLASQESATSSIFDNTSNLYVDVLVGGFVDFTGTSAVAGDSVDIYVVGNYQTATATDMTGGIDALFDASTEEVADTAFIRSNLPLIHSIQLHGTPTTAIGYHWGPIGIAQFFGGVMPQKFMLLCHANTASSLAGTNAASCNAVGITYTTV
jgi:hypothetical protein